MEIDTWVGASGKNGMRRDWILRSKATGLVFARATRLTSFFLVFLQDIILDIVVFGDSTWVMMNQETRRLSKMPDEVRAEISPWFILRQAIEEESPEKIPKLDSNAQYVRSNLKVGYLS